MDKKHNRIIYCLYFGAFLILWILLFWKCRYGFPLDETFYVLFCYRFMNGDIPILHEWNPTQVSAVWLHPFVWLFYKFSGSSEQVIIAFRYLFTAVWGLSSLFLFFRLKKLSLPGSAAASLLFLIYVPYGQQALYYNTIGLITFTCAAAIIITAEKYKNIQYVIAGFLFAVAVTCCPFLLLLYTIFFVVAIVSLLRKNKELFKLFCFVTLGTIPAVIIFYCYYILPSSIKEFVGGLHYLMEDREHQFTYLGKVIGFFKSIINSSIAVKYVVLLIAAAILFALLKKTEKVRISGLIVTCVSVIALDAAYLMETGTSNFSVMFTPLFVGLYCGLLTKDQTAKRVFRFMWLPGLIYMFCINISSTVGFDAVVIPGLICTFASCFLAVLFWKENTAKESKGKINKLAVFAVMGLFLLTLGSETFARSTFVCGAGRLDDLTAKIEQGPYKNLYCAPKTYERYSAIVRDLEPLKADSSKKVLLLTNYWFYLDINSKPTTSSCYFPFVDDIFLDQLEEYYQLYPQFVPDVIYVGHNHTDLLERVKSYGYSGEQTELGGYILYRK